MKHFILTVSTEILKLLGDYLAQKSHGPRRYPNRPESNGYSIRDRVAMQNIRCALTYFNYVIREKVRNSGRVSLGTNSIISDII